MGAGRPVEWTKERIDEVFPEIFERISEGEHIKSILRSDKNKFPSSMMFYSIIDQYEELSKQLTQAYRGFKDHYTHEIIDVAYKTEEGRIYKDTPKGLETTTGDMTAHRRLKVDAISKMLGFTITKVGNQNATKKEEDDMGDFDAVYE